MILRAEVELAVEVEDWETAALAVEADEEDLDRELGADVVGVLGAVYAAASVDVCRNGECVQSGTWIETSTKGSTTALSRTSRPEASLKRGSC